VVAVSDINLDNAHDAVRALGLEAEVSTDGLDVIHAPVVEALIVTSWDPTHEAFTLAAIEAVKPVFCEKLLAITAEGCPI